MLPSAFQTQIYHLVRSIKLWCPAYDSIRPVSETLKSRGLAGNPGSVLTTLCPRGRCFRGYWSCALGETEKYDERFQKADGRAFSVDSGCANPGDRLGLANVRLDQGSTVSRTHRLGGSYSCLRPGVVCRLHRRPEPSVGGCSQSRRDLFAFGIHPS